MTTLAEMYEILKLKFSKQNVISLLNTKFFFVTLRANLAKFQEKFCDFLDIEISNSNLVKLSTKTLNLS